MASPTDAEEVLSSTKGKENFQRLASLLMCGGVTLLREMFDSFHSPTDLPLKLGDPAIEAQLKGAKLTKPMWDCLYPSPGTFGKSTDFDITLTFRLLKTICNLTEPPTGWDNLPNSADHSLEADLARIKFYRNSVYGHNMTMEITDSEFGNLWREISEALLRIAGSISQVKRDEWKKSIDKLLHDPFTVEKQRNADELQLWYKNDLEVKKAVEQLRDQLQQPNVEVRDQLQQVHTNISAQFQQVNEDVTDQLQQVTGTDIRNQLQQLNQRLDSQPGRITIVVEVHHYHHQGNRQDPPMPKLTIWNVIKARTINLFLKYFKDRRGIGVESYNLGSLLITVTCNSLQILEGLWEDYSSGHLNKLAEETLVTSQVLEELGLDELKLKTTITEDEYRKCKEFFLGTEQSFETERNLKEEEGLLQQRHQLMNYDFQKCPRNKEDAFQELDVDDIDLVRIAVIGPAGAGKTNLIGTLQRALKEPQTSTAMDLDQERLAGSIILEEHYLQKKIRMVDTRGFYLSDGQLEDELLNILSGRIRPGDAIVRNYDKEGDKMANTATRIDPGLSEYVHAVIFVLNGNDPFLMDGRYRDKLQIFREHLNKEGYAPVTAISSLDKLTLKKEDKDAVFKMAQKTTGSSDQRIYFIENNNGRESDKAACEVDRTALDILDSALVSAERFIRIKKQQEKNQMERKIMTGVVPAEILARGPLALEAYNKAITEGKTTVKRVPAMLIGQDRSGKTSLKKSLMGKPFNPDEDSTVGIDADPSYFQVSTEVWKAGKNDQENDSEISISYEEHAARLTVENLRKEDSTPSDSVPESIHTDTLTSDVTAMSANSDLPISRCHDSAEEDRNEFDSELSASDVANASIPDTAKLSDLSEQRRPHATSRVKTSTDPELGGNTPDIPEDIASLIEMRLKEGDAVEDEESIISVLWDFGGQSVYYTTHPLFLTSRAIFLLVHDLSRNPHGRAKSVMKQGMFTKIEDSFDLRTNLDYLDFWMSSVASIGSSESNHEGPNSEVLPEKLPPVFLVCTHADTPCGDGDPSALANNVFGFLQTKPYKTHLYDEVFVVDNTKSGHESECSGVVCLRKEVLAVAKELPQMKEAIPIKWLKYEKSLQVLKDNDHKWISLDSARQIASEVCNIVDSKEFHTLLNFLHDQRILIHFDDSPELNKLVVLDPQGLIDVFKEVITIRPYEGKEKKFKELWCKLEKEGILEEKLLEHVWGPSSYSKETTESLVSIMEKFSLLCPLPLSDDSCSKSYLVPSMLMSHPPEGVMELIKSAKMPSVFLKFESGFVPLGFYPRLVLQFFQWVKEECLCPADPQFYHNFARFYTSEEENCSVILLCHSLSIEVVVHLGNASPDLVDRLDRLTLSADASQVTSDVTCARAVRRQLELMLESMRNEFCWLKNMSYEVSFICPVCCQGGSVNYCRTHCAQDCKQEECLHFWSETQLCNNKSITCTKSAVAQNNRIPIEQFSPWLLPLRNQLTANEHDGSNTASAKASKEVALPGEVQESLLSQSCDAKEVVLQLGEAMQLDQASLEEPKPETKTLIRCLARKAKDSNRLDVFEHLREITPAGTTGPLLPENLDVRGIPHSKRRELTIDLCGGDDWKVVAEGLGLTPQEIRFLDKRTLNPLDAALAFIAKQRHITVGELYDLLNERGFPMLADLL